MVRVRFPAAVFKFRWQTVLDNRCQCRRLSVSVLPSRTLLYTKEKFIFSGHRLPYVLPSIATDIDEVLVPFLEGGFSRGIMRETGLLIKERV